MINLCLGSVCLNATDRLAAVATAHGLPLNITRSAFDERFSGWFDRDPHRSQELKGAPATALASTNRHTMDDILERHGLAHKDLAAPHRIAMGLYVEPRHEIHTRLLRRKARCEVRSDGLMRLEDVQRVEWHALLHSLFANALGVHYVVQ